MVQRISCCSLVVVNYTVIDVKFGVNSFLLIPDCYLIGQLIFKQKNRNWNWKILAPVRIKFCFQLQNLQSLVPPVAQLRVLYPLGCHTDLWNKMGLSIHNEYRWSLREFAIFSGIGVLQLESLALGFLQPPLMTCKKIRNWQGFVPTDPILLGLRRLE